MLKSLHFTSLQVKEKKIEKYFVFYIYMRKQCVQALIYVFVCAVGSIGCHDWGIRKCIFFFFQFLSVCLFCLFVLKSIALCVVVFLPRWVYSLRPYTVQQQLPLILLRRSMQILTGVSFVQVTHPRGPGSCSDLPEFEDPAWCIMLIIVPTRSFNKTPGETVDGGLVQC